MEKKNYKYYIAGLKGFACVLIMICHYLGLYKYAQQFNLSFPLLDAALNSPLAFLLNEGFWLKLFYVVSGYLVAKSFVYTAGDVLRKSINRFFRFAFPILFAYAVIYLISVFAGFHSAETTSLFQCDWYQLHYLDKFRIVDVLRSPIDVLALGDTSNNSPYWVLKEMFIASILIYVLKYAYLHMTEKKHDAFGFSVMVIITIASMLVSEIVGSCLIGMLVSLYEGTDVYKKPYFAFWVMAGLMVQYIMPKTSIVFFASLIVCIPNVRFLDRLLSSKLFQFFGKISWGVFSFHWPIICSLGALLIMKLNAVMGFASAYAVACVLAFIITIALSVGFYYTLEKLAIKLTKKIDIFMKQLLFTPKTT